MTNTPAVPISSGAITDWQLMIYLGGYAAAFRDVTVRTGMSSEDAIETASQIVDTLVTSEPRILDGMRTAIATLLTTVPGEYGMLRPHRHKRDDSDRITDRQIVIYLAGYAAALTDVTEKTGVSRDQAQDQASRVVNEIVTNQPAAVDNIRDAITELVKAMPDEYGMLRPHQRKRDA